MTTYQDSSMFSRRSGAALAAVALLHGIAGSAFYFGLAQPLIQRFTAPITIDPIPKPHEKEALRPAEPKMDHWKLRAEPPENPGYPPSESGVETEPTRLDPQRRPVALSIRPASEPPERP